MLSRLIPMLAAAIAAFGQGGGPSANELGTGKFLVAMRDLPDPNFAETVVLLTRYGEDGAMGLIVNRQTRAAVANVFDHVEGAKGRQEPVFLGGPVGKGGLLALLRSKTKPADATQVMADVYLIHTRAELERQFKAGTGPDSLRLYMGYAGWAPDQLEHEVSLGSWHILRADPGSVFDTQPDRLWKRLIERTEVRFASGPRFYLLDFSCLAASARKCLLNESRQLLSASR